MKEAQQKERQLISDFAALVEEHVADTAAPLGQAQLALEQVRRYRVMQYAFRGTSHGQQGRLHNTWPASRNALALMHTWYETSPAELENDPPRP